MSEQIETPDDDVAPVAGRTDLQAYLELLRLPNVFTAMADVMMGYIVVMRTIEPVVPLLLLMIASSCLYLAGMVFNDVFDREIDRLERPTRPIPSGRVSVRAAWRLGITLIAVALATAGYLARDEGNPLPLAAAFAVAVLAVSYDKWLKHTILAPIAMGGCRFFNVLLGMSVNGWPNAKLEWILASAIGIYVVGLTIFARKEAETSRRLPLVIGLAAMLAGMAMIGLAPRIVGQNDWRLQGLPEGWSSLWVILVAHRLYRCLPAIVRLDPRRVQSAVKSCILSIIVIDAAASMTTAGLPYFPFAILILIIPATLLGRRIYST